MIDKINILQYNTNIINKKSMIKKIIIKKLLKRVEKWCEFDNNYIIIRACE